MSHPHTDEMLTALKPFFPSFAAHCQRIEQRQLKTCSILGLPRKTERPTDWHRAWRNLFVPWCDETNGLFEFIEECDRSHLDYISCNLIMDKPFAIRFGRLNNGKVKRNNTHRQSRARTCGMLSSDYLIEGVNDPEPDALCQVTLAYSLADDYTERGLPAWWMDRLVLGKEQMDGFDMLSEVAKFDPPQMQPDSDIVRAVYVPKPSEREIWKREINDAMGGAA